LKKNRKIVVNKRIIIITAHVAAWVCFFLLPYIFYPQQPKDIPDTISKHFHTSLIVNDIFLLLFYYFNTLILIPKLLFKQKSVWYTLINIACFIAFLYIPKMIVDYISPENIDALQQMRNMRRGGGPRPQGGPPPNGGAFSRRFNFFPWSYAVFLLVYTIGTCISVMQRWRQTERNKQEIENEKLNTELSFLRSQVNPHFLFNTLNNIYSLASVRSEQTAPAVMKLSSIMRYILSETQTNLVPIQQEIDFIKNFIDLHLVRLTDKVHVNFTADTANENTQIAPLLFISFVENAFKYGISTKETTDIDIKLSATTEKVSFSVINSIIKTENTIHDKTGIGINNVKRRLELLYPDKHTLSVVDNGNKFIVHLDILLK